VLILATSRRLIHTSIKISHRVTETQSFFYWFHPILSLFPSMNLCDSPARTAAPGRAASQWLLFPSVQCYPVKNGWGFFYLSFSRASSHFLKDFWLSPEDFPKIRFSTLISSSSSGQWIPSLPPISRHLLRSSGVPCRRRGN
jgi:hypothetical protein